MPRPTTTEKTRLKTMRSDDEVKCRWSGPVCECSCQLSVFSQPRRQGAQAALGRGRRVLLLVARRGEVDAPYVELFMIFSWRTP